MDECVMWVDFSCINQDKDPAGELKQLASIVSLCDCLLTPIHEKGDYQLPPVFKNWYEDYSAPSWNQGEHAYLNRGTCLFYPRRLKCWIVVVHQHQTNKQTTNKPINKNSQPGAE